MSKNKLVTRFVKGPKPIWAPDKDGAIVCHEIGAELRLAPNTAHAKRRYLFTPEEHKAHLATLKANIQASQDEKTARDEEDEEEEEDSEKERNPNAATPANPAKPKEGQKKAIPAVPAKKAGGDS